MLCQRPMTRLAVDPRMLSFLFQFEHVGVAHLAALVAGKGNWVRSDFGDCVASVMAVLPKAARDKEASRQQEQDCAYQEDQCKPQQVSCIFEYFHGCIRNALQATDCVQ